MCTRYDSLDTNFYDSGQISLRVFAIYMENSLLLEISLQSN